LPGIVKTLEELDCTAVKDVLLKPLQDTCNDLSGYRDMVEQTVDMDLVEHGDFLIRASFDDKLKELKEKLDSIESKMERELKAAIEALDVDVKLDYVGHLGYHFRMTLKEEAALRKNSNYKIIDTARGGCRFNSEKLVDLNAKYTTVKEAYEEQQKDIVEEVVKVAAGYLGPLTNLNHNLAQLDCLTSFAEVAGTSPGEYVRPKMYEDQRILDIKMLRHPCIEYQEEISFIPNDVMLKQDETLMYVLFGPNMGGKSSYVRSVGVAVLMAHIGSFVPAREAHISVMDSILGRIGADDNIMKGLSTFMVEMVETAAIIRTATDKSLVIIDELGRGTSTFEGCGIAWSIAEHLAEKTKCFTLFATHFHEIAELADQCSVVKNYHMAAIAEDDKLTLLYQVSLNFLSKLHDNPSNIFNKRSVLASSIIALESKSQKLPIFPRKS
jgi:DNA mismatch repair protein MSH2